MMRSGHRPLALLAGCLGLAVIAGCAAATSARPASPASSPSPSPGGVNVSAFDALARQEASAWARSPLAKVWRTGLVVLQAGDLSAGPSGGFPSGAAKLAFINGDLVFTGPPPSAAPAGVVTWPDGSTMKVPVLSEARVLGELTSGRQCPGCVTTPLAVTAARPTTLDVATSRGSASVPAWAFTLKGVSAPVIQAALPPGSYVTPHSDGTSTEKLRPLGTSFVGAGPASASADGRTLTVGLPGSPCDTTWGGLDAEFGGVVVVGGWMQDPDLDQSCTAMLQLRKVTIRLAAPLGDRVILDAATGQPVTQEPAAGGP